MPFNISLLRQGHLQPSAVSQLADERLQHLPLPVCQIQGGSNGQEEGPSNQV